MNRTLTVNLGGTIYQIDEEAHRLLDNYLSILKQYFRKQEGADEIVADIENRIAELFAERISLEKKIISVADVEEVIDRMGKPEDFGNVVEELDEKKSDATARTPWQKAADGIISVIGFIIKFSLIVIFCPLLVVGAFLLIAALLGLIITLCGGGTLLSSFLPPINGSVVVWESSWLFFLYSVHLLFIGIPLYAIVHSALRSTFRWRPITSKQKRGLLISWLILLPIILILWFVSINTMSFKHEKRTFPVSTEDVLEQKDTTHIK